uniref:Uncharacterized protein n=1 Tax=Acrobeloides nanus TaxID=290746 RepID=A0A914BY25_9BILA
MVYRTLNRAGNRGDGHFSINNWNVYQRSLQGDMKTNNSLEGSHLCFNRYMQGNEKDIWKWIRRLISYDEVVYGIVRQWENGHLPCRSRKWMGVERKKQSLVEAGNLVNADDEKITYLRTIAMSLCDTLD